ncbi:MAG: DUF748 domain-containing protein [Mangrovibacterium sp.]|nr:DUF748 domain-containing protein [Mangrovibacterium sp.]
MKEKIRIRLKKRFIIPGIALLVIVFILLLLPGIARNYLVDHGEALTGRKIALEKLKVNYFRVSVKALNFDLYEQNKEGIFVHFDELRINFDPWRLLQKEYTFSEIFLVKPSLSVLYSGSGFNFSDLMRSGDTTVSGHEEPVKYVIKNLTISDGYIRYEDKTVSSISELKQLSLKIPEIAWDNSHATLGVDFVLGESGKVTIGGDVDQAAGRYTVTVKTDKIDIEPFAGYFKSYVDAGSIKGLLNADVVVSGEMENPVNVKVFGEGSLDDFSLAGVDQQKVLSAKKAWTKIDSLDMGRWNFCFADIQVEEPVVNVILDREGTNVEKILAPYLADTLSAGSDSTEVRYSIRNLDLKSGSIAFTDRTLHRPFHFDMTSLDFTMKDLRDDAATIPMAFSMSLNQTGVLKGKAQMDMVNPLNVVFDGNIQGLDMVSFSPYSEYYLARPVTRGVFHYDLRLVMTPVTLQNDNRISIDHLEIGKRTKEKPVYRVPVGLALYVLKDRNNHIGFDLPVTGNPSSPKFKLRRIIWKTFEEFLLKTGTQPINFIGQKLGVDPKSIRQIPFDFLQDSLSAAQVSSLDKISEIMDRKPELTFSFVQTTNPDEEKALIAVRQARALYASWIAQSGTAQVRVAGPEVADQDPGFLAFLGLAADAADVTGEHYRMSCLQKAGSDKVLSEFNRLLDKRQRLLEHYFAEKGVAAESFVLKRGDLRNLPDEMKKPQFVVEVSLD